MTTTTPLLAPLQSPDADLVALSLSGDRDAFGRIVGKYQTLICSLAFSATGSVSQSEDVTQETFLIAWRKLPELREPVKLRAWLCGIARNVANNSGRRQRRDPTQGGPEIDDGQSSNEPTPDQEAITREEQAILWKSLSQIPEIYREPLVLFYREEQSVARVAEAMELSEEAVRKRLSRGRQLLAAKLENFVEGALKQSSPGRAFTVGVVAALPFAATGAKAAAVGSAAAKGSALAKSAALVGTFNLLLGPAIGILGGILGARAGMKSALTPRERKFFARNLWKLFVAIFVLDALIALYIGIATQYWSRHPILFASAGVGIPLSAAVVVIAMIVRFKRQFRALRAQEQTAFPEVYEDQPSLRCVDYRSRISLLGLPVVRIRSGTRPGERPQTAVGWIALGDHAVGIIFAAGGTAVGAISMGGVAIGIVSVGGIGIGILSLAGIAVGGWAMGGFAVGFVACGGIVTAWHSALGGLAAARDFAVGGEAVARHANDAMAEGYFAQYPWLDIRKTFWRNLFVSGCWLPLILFALLWPAARRLTRRKMKTD